MRLIHLCAAWWVALGSVAARADVETAIGRNEAGAPAFKLDTVPPPSKNDAAARAKITVVEGTRDRAGGELEVLNDGAIPRADDQPRANFFFAPGTNGGRLLFDLGVAIDVKQVNTYSWHPGPRGPQVYKMYGSDGLADGFNPQPNLATDPAKAGWTLVAAVDSRPKAGEPGGQYGVSVSNAAGNLGKFRYLLFDVAATERDDGFGNTFYSEIDVVDAAATEAPVAAAPAGNRGGAGRMIWETTGPADPNGPAPTVARTEGGHEITFDYSETPELKDWVEGKLKPVCVKWYPIIVAMLPSDGFEAPRKFSIAFRKEFRGVAAAAGTRINGSADWFRRNMEGEGIGAIVHEMVHVVQQYRGSRGGNRNPGWLVEGVADYIRWFNFEPESARPRPRADRANYNDSYRTTGHFLDYVSQKYDREIVRKLNAAMREGRYADTLWKDITGKTAEDLGREWKQTLPGGDAANPAAGGGTD